MVEVSRFSGETLTVFGVNGMLQWFRETFDGVRVVKDGETLEI